MRPRRVRAIALDLGWVLYRPSDDKLGEREETRQNDLGRLVRLAEELGGTGAEFQAELEQGFGQGGESGAACTCSRYHGAKGLEFEVVLLPRLEEKELPSKQAKSRSRDRRGTAPLLRRVDAGEAVAHGNVGRSKPSRVHSGARTGRGPSLLPRGAGGLEALKAWRLSRARSDEIPAYVVFHNATLEEIAGRRAARALAELAAVPGVGPAKLERYGEEVLAALAAVA